MCSEVSAAHLEMAAGQCVVWGAEGAQMEGKRVLRGGGAGRKGQESLLGLTFIKFYKCFDILKSL